MGRGDRRHYIKEVKIASKAKCSADRVVYRDSRCPGCHGHTTLKYQVEKVGDSYRYRLLSSSIAHAACEGALEEIRKANPAWFRREINAKANVSKT